MTTAIAIASAQADTVPPKLDQKSLVPARLKTLPSTVDGSGNVSRLGPAQPDRELGSTEQQGKTGRAERDPAENGRPRGGRPLLGRAAARDAAYA